MKLVLPVAQRMCEDLRVLHQTSENPWRVEFQ